MFDGMAETAKDAMLSKFAENTDPAHCGAASCKSMGTNLGEKCRPGEQRMSCITLGLEDSCDLRCPAMMHSAQRTTGDWPDNCKR